jgi:hypothetical protein
MVKVVVAIIILLVIILVSETLMVVVLALRVLAIFVAVSIISNISARRF